MPQFDHHYWLFQIQSFVKMQPTLERYLRPIASYNRTVFRSVATYSQLMVSNEFVYMGLLIKFCPHLSF